MSEKVIAGEEILHFDLIQKPGSDPLEQFWRTPDNWAEACLEAAENNVKYLKKA